MTDFKLGTTNAEHGHLTSLEQFLLPADSLTTHGLILGQTGSGKTGMGISLLEEAAIAGIPCIAVDPKGDLGNLLLQFPDCLPSDFAPWTDDPNGAAETWCRGLGIDRQRINELLNKTDLRIYTPGSTRGWPLAILSDLLPPGVSGEDQHRLVQAETVGLLDLAGVKCDPVSGAEALLLSTLIERAWLRGNILELDELVRLVSKPPIKKIGALSLEAACPKRKRKVLAQKLNAMISSPAMRSWSAGEELDVDSLLLSKEGKPRVSILSIAHLGDQERMFFLTKLLSEIVVWMRQQPGSSELKALLYLDEVFGYLPPVKNPPSKEPLLLLLKQARAFGLGVVLASQNPIDVDYRALSNLGTWMLGRLQTERDVTRVIDGLKAAAAEQGEDLDVGELRATMAGLPKRTFLVRTPSLPGYKLVKTRHTLSFLRGPLTLDEIATLSTSPPEPVAEWSNPPGLADVVDDIGTMTDQAEELMAETREALKELAPDQVDVPNTPEEDLLIQAVAGPVEILSRCRTVKPGEVDKAKARLERLKDNIKRSDELIEEGRYEEANAIWDTNPVVEEAVCVGMKEPDIVVLPAPPVSEERTRAALEALNKPRSALEKVPFFFFFFFPFIGGLLGSLLVWVVILLSATK